MTAAIVPIVEGASEAESVPVLLRRILADRNRFDVEPARPFRVKRYTIVKDGELERAVKLAVLDRSNAAAVMVLLDADDDCPADLGPRLLQRARNATHLPVRVVLARTELECWFLGAKQSLRGARGIRNTAVNPQNPEDIRGAKERLSRNMEGRNYLTVDDQPALAARMDVDMARRNCPSFNRFIRVLDELLQNIHQEPNP